jgi:cell division protein FtsB
MHVPPAWRRWGARVGLSVALAIAIAYVPWRVHSDQRIERLRDQLAGSRAEIARLTTDNARLAREIDALEHDVGAIVDHARDDLGMVYPGELVLRVGSDP